MGNSETRELQAEEIGKLCSLWERLSTLADLGAVRAFRQIFFRINMERINWFNFYVK